MKPKSKIIKHLEKLINQISSLSKDKNLPYSRRYDLWKRRVEIFLNQVCGEDIAEEFKNIIREGEPLERGFVIFSSENSEQQLEKRRQRQKLNCELALDKARNLLKALKEYIELFESDKQVKKEVETIKRKYKKWGIDFKFLKHEKGEETETKSQ